MDSDLYAHYQSFYIAHFFQHRLRDRLPYFKEMVLVHQGALKAKDASPFMQASWNKGSIKVPAEDGKMRFWRNTAVATQAPGTNAQRLRPIRWATSGMKIWTTVRAQRYRAHVHHHQIGAESLDRPRRRQPL